MTNSMSTLPKKLFAPYAPPSNVLDIIRRYRERSLPPQTNLNLLRDLGISPGTVHRTLASLKFLGLVHEDDSPTSHFVAIQTATDDEYRAILEGLVKDAYKEAFKIINPEKDALYVIDNHFRRYEPLSQRQRMITLFLSLCQEAGLAVPEPPRQSSRRKPAEGTQPKRVAGPSRSGVKETDEATTILLDPVARLRHRYIAALVDKIGDIEADDEEATASLMDRVERLLQEEEQRSTDTGEKAV